MIVGKITTIKELIEKYGKDAKIIEIIKMEGK